MIPTRTLKYWGFKEHPFADNILRDDLLKLFIDRKTELLDVEDALGHSRIVGVYGSLGVGKSSFLQKLKQELNSLGHIVAYVHLTADSEETIYRELLAELLYLIKSRILKLEKEFNLNIDEEIQRLYASVSKSRGANFGGNLFGLGGGLQENLINQMPEHSESSARHLIHIIFCSLQTSLVIIFDDFEKLRYESNGKMRDYFLILSRFIATLEESFNHKAVSFVVTMDNLVNTYVQKYRKEGGEFAFSLNSLCELPNLKLEYLYDFIEVRLHEYNWKNGVDSFITNEAFLALSLTSANHPRRIVRMLAEALKFVAIHDYNEKKIDILAIRYAVLKTQNKLDEKDFIILSYLIKYGESSAADDKLRQALGFKKSKRADGYHKSVAERLRSVAEKLNIKFDEVSTGNTKKKVLRIPYLLKD